MKPIPDWLFLLVIGVVAYCTAMASACLYEIAKILTELRQNLRSAKLEEEEFRGSLMDHLSEIERLLEKDDEEY